MRSFFKRAGEAALTGIARRSPGARTLRRAAKSDTPAFDLGYVRCGTPSALPPVVFIPGGPGLGSVLPYRALRSLATKAGLDVVMVEHRGVGLSRYDLTGAPLPPRALRIVNVLDDIRAVLDHEGIDKACIVGSSYGSYLASSFGAAYPERVASMLLDSALQSASHLEIEREAVRRLLWDRPGEVTESIRKLSTTPVPDRVLLDVTRAAYEVGGDELLLPLVRHRLRRGGSVAWSALEATATRDASMSRIPCFYEFDLAGIIGFRELGYRAEGDGHPLDPALTYSPLTNQFPAFAGEPFDLLAAAANFDWPLVLLSGTRDLRTPQAIARTVSETAPDATFVSIENGHSALESHPVALLNAVFWLLHGRHHELPALVPRLDRLPKRGFMARYPELLRRCLKLGF